MRVRGHDENTEGRKVDYDALPMRVSAHESWHHAALQNTRFALHLTKIVLPFDASDARAFSSSVTILSKYADFVLASVSNVFFQIPGENLEFRRFPWFSVVILWGLRVPAFSLTYEGIWNRLLELYVCQRKLWGLEFESSSDVRHLLSGQAMCDGMGEESSDCLGHQNSKKNYLSR